ncbi:Bacterial membrane flanked domain protein [Pirellulimonas nuda]|uniref:Bacterial membrane flanked domain protein n=1 Tax=Pirellulimonas nuda TaxID=2528009 RepID=A0A518DIA5_9BACT|nr:PH domain-containing protein [Pirellulimonas nuda]QDU91122.1 Bacterial membrane flanked domain protein [Pirellulimonas nuda]
MQCPKCQAEVAEESVYCPKCGGRLDARHAPSDLKTPEADPAAPPAAEAPRERFLRAAASKQTDGEETEEQLWQGSYAKMAMIGSWAAGGLATVAAPIVLGVAGMLSGGGLFWLLIGLLVMWVLLVGLYFYRRFSVHYTLTTQRLIHESGLLWRTIDRVELIDIDDVTFRQDPVQRAFGVGTIQIDSSDTTTPKLKLPGIERVRYVADLIDDARRRERRRRGLHIEAV